MKLRDRYATDKNVEKTGVWYSITDEDEKEICAFRIARAGGANTSHTTAIDRLTKPHRRAIARDLFSVTRMAKISRQAFVAACLLDWRGEIGFADGTEAGAFSKKSAEQLLEEMPDLADDLILFAMSPTAFRADIRECESEN